MTTMPKDLVQLRQLLESQPVGVLATQHSGRPHASLMAYAVTANLRIIVFASQRSTRKFMDMLHCGHVAFLVDNRRQSGSAEFAATVTATAEGMAVPVATTEIAALQSLLLARHPDLADFLHSNDCVLLQLNVASYRLVNGLSDVQNIQP